MRKIDFAVQCLLFCIAASCHQAQNIKTIRAEGSAMAPTIKDGDELKLDLDFYVLNPEIKRFDIVSFRLSDDQKIFIGRTGDLFYTKRIVGLPNETIEIRNGTVLINGTPLEEPFEREMRDVDDFGPIKIPANEFFLLGDNRPNSADSRMWMPATTKKEDVLGKIVEVVASKK